MISEDGIEDDEELAHAGCERLFGFFACGDQPLVVGRDDWISTACDESGHVQGTADPYAATFDVTPTTVFPGVVGHRRDTDEGSDLSAGERAEFRQFGNQQRGNPWTDTWNGLQQLVFFPPGRGSADGLIDVLLEIAELFLESGEDPIETFDQLGTRKRTPAIAFNAHGLDDLAPAGHEFAQHLCRLIRDFLSLDFGVSAVSGDEGGVDPIGLCQTSQSLSIGPDPARIDDREGKPRRRKRAGHDGFEAPRRFHDNELWFEDQKTLDQFFEAYGVSRNAKRCLGRKNMDIKLVF